MIVTGMTVRELLFRALQRFSGAAPGCNGPWNNCATPVRTSAHWLILHAWAYEQTAQRPYLEVARQLAEYLISPEARPYGYAFYNLVGHPSPGNGLIGQAWVMEALLTASAILEEPKYSRVATELFWQHRYDEEKGLWHVLHPDGSVGAIHPTLNQQVWFAAMGARLGCQEAMGRVRQFLDKVDAHLHLLKGGLLGMHIRGQRKARPSQTLSLTDWVVRLRWSLHTIKARLSGRWRGFSYWEMSAGYHAFTLYGFALLKESFPDHPLWSLPRLQRAIRWTYSESHKRALRRNPIAMGYNPAGFEVPYVLSVFRPLSASQLVEEARWWLNEQVRRHFNPETGQFDRNTPDAATLTSRLYEATRLPTDWLDMPLKALAEVQ